eukprot:scaffold377879_cov35-Attheya_sp.AAC.1
MNHSHLVSPVFCSWHDGVSIVDIERYISFRNSWKHQYDAVYVYRSSGVTDFETVAKWGVDMVTRGGELLIATRCSADDGRRKGSNKGGAAFSLLSYRTNRLPVPIILATAPHVSNLHTRNVVRTLSTYLLTTYDVPFLPVRGDCAEATTHSWMESGIRHK